MPTQTCQDNFKESGKKKWWDERYKAPFKSAINYEKAGKREYGVAVVAKEINSTMLSSPNDRKLSKMSLYIKVLWHKHVSKSPPQWGHPQYIPSALSCEPATYSAMMQFSREGRASAVAMKATLHPLVAGMPHKNKFNVKYVLRCTKESSRYITPSTGKEKWRSAYWLAHL